MADGKIEIETEINTSKVDKGLAKIDKEMEQVADSAEEMGDAIKDGGGSFDKAGKSTESFSDKMGKLTKAYAPQIAAVAALGKALKKELEIIRETSDAYKIQANAENALATAAANNPMINSEAVDNLKAFASEMQGVSNLGDEFIIGFETQLVAAGRTEEEIKKIIKVAADVSAAGTMSFDSAVSNLNKTFAGLAGELGETIPELKNLTAEELQAGAAVDLLGEKYKGMASELVDAKTQAQNAKGDFAEAIGALTAPAANAWDNFWKGFYEKGIKMINAVNDRLELLNIDNKKLLKDLDVEAYKFNAAGESGLTVQNTEALAQAQRLLNNKEKLNKITADEKQLLIYINAELRKRETAEKYAVEQEQKEIKLQQEKQKQLDKQLETEKKITSERDKRNQRAAQIKESSDESLRATIERLEAEAAYTGKAVDEQAKYNAIYNSYLDLMAQDNKLISEKNDIITTRLEQLKEQKAKTDEYVESLKKKEEAEGLKEKAAGFTQDKSEIEQVRDEAAELQALRQQVIDNEILSEEEKKEALAQIDAEIVENRKNALETYANSITQYANEWLDVIKDIGGLAEQYTTAQNEAELADLEKKYKKGEIGEEEYSKKKKEIREKAARDEYAANMASWTASLLTATANIAQGVTKAIAQGGPMGIATGALVSAAGAVQLASIIGSKPTPPKFAEGGIVGGTSYSGDNIAARVNSGEMVLTMAQQRALFDVANGRGSMGAPNITINNSASNLVKATPSISQDRINIMIDARVNESLQAGKYDTSLTMAQQGMQGKFYGI